VFTGRRQSKVDGSFATLRLAGKSNTRKKKKKIKCNPRRVAATYSTCLVLGSLSGLFGPLLCVCDDAQNAAHPSRSSTDLLFPRTLSLCVRFAQNPRAHLNLPVRVLVKVKVKVPSQHGAVGDCSISCRFPLPAISFQDNNDCREEGHSSFPR
jgi:hypothetical protein